MSIKSASIRYSSFLWAFYSSSFYHFLAFISALIPKIINICHRICFVVAKECLCLLRLRQSFLMFRIKSRDPSQSRLRMTLLLSLRGHAFALYGRGNLSFIFEGVRRPFARLPPKMKKNKNYFVILNGVKNLAFGDSGWSFEEGALTSSN